LFGISREKPDFKLRFRKPPGPLKDFATIVACVSLLLGLPYVEELWGCYQAKKDGMGRRDNPESALQLYASS